MTPDQPDPLAAGGDSAVTPEEPLGPPIDLAADPFGEAEQAEPPVEVAGSWGARPLIRWLMKRGGREGAEDAVEDGIEAGVRESMSEERALVGPVVEGETLGPEMVVKTGTTRDLPNAAYYGSEETQNILGLLKEHADKPRVVTHEETLAAAGQRETLQSLTGKEPALNWNPAELTMLRQSLEGQGKELAEFNAELLGKKRNGIEPSPEELAQFELLSRRLVATQNAVAGLSSEAARLLNALKITADSPGSYYRDVARVVEEGGGAENIMEKMAAVARAKTPRQVQQAVRETWSARAWDAILKVRYNLMLSSVRTHAANIAGSGMAGTYETLFVDPVSYLNNFVERTGRRALGGQFTRSDDIVATPLIGAEGWGLLKGAKDGIALAYDIARGTADPASMQGKFVTEMGMRYKPDEIPASALGKVATSPTRMLEAEDAFFRSVYFNKRLYGLAVAQATAEAGGDRQLKAQLTQKYLAEPTDSMLAEAGEYSKKLTFTNDPSIYGKMLGTLAQSMSRLTESGPFKLLVPFVRTPANLLGYTLEQSIMGPVVKPLRTWQAITGNDARARADALARTQIAAGLMYALYDTWAEGTITGMGSANYGTVKVMETNGWRQNSFCTEETCYQLNRADPLGSTLGMIATTYEFWNETSMSVEDKTAATGAVLLQLAELLTDRSYLSSVGQFFDAMGAGSGGLKSAQSLVASTATSMVLPNVLRDAREMTDEFARAQEFDPRGEDTGLLLRWQKNLMNALPGYSKQLPPQIDWRGEPVTNDGHYLVRGLIPVRMGDKRRGDDFDLPSAELLRNNVTPSKPKTSLAVRGTAGMFEIPLLSLDDGKGHIYAYYQQKVGRARHKAVKKVIESRAYRRLVDKGLTGTSESPAGRGLRKAVDAATEAAKNEFLGELDRGATVTSWDGEKLKLPDLDFPALSKTVKARTKGKERETPEHFRERRRADPTMPDWLLSQDAPRF